MGGGIGDTRSERIQKIRENSKPFKFKIDPLPKYHEVLELFCERNNLDVVSSDRINTIYRGLVAYLANGEITITNQFSRPTREDSLYGEDTSYVSKARYQLRGRIGDTELELETEMIYKKPWREPGKTIDLKIRREDSQKDWWFLEDYNIEDAKRLGFTG